MNDLIQRIVLAIFRQEGMPADYPNPGNLRGAVWLPGSHVHNGFWEPDSRAQGVAGAAHLVALRIAEGYTLAELIGSWAPVPDGNPTAQYIANVKQWAAIPDEHAALWNFLLTEGT